MYTIYKVRADHVIDFAAEELKKYLRMMMPACGDIAIVYQPGAEDGFRLGLLEDFGLDTSDVEEPVLDDVVQILADENGGILAGSNPRSVLFAVYRYLKENGCRWLFPGVDGEYIPMQPVQPVTYRHKASHRFRGHCNEGAEFQQSMLETIDYFAKLEMNVYMLEFDIPFTYYNTYYTHRHNEENRPPEPVTPDTVLQWKRQCEAEIAKRGLQFHDMGHGWTAEPFGISSTAGWAASTQEIPAEVKECLAMTDGERKLWGGVPLNTNLCMSKPEVRTRMAQAIADYAENHQNVSYIHVWLADGSRNHCECEECRKLRPSDYYIMIMNELDEELTRRNLASKIVFIAYVDTLFAPRQEKIRNPGRFALLYAPIQRSYTSSIRMDKITEPPEYERNRWASPTSSEANAAFLLDWQKDWHGPCFTYEYHFWRHMCYDPGAMTLSRRIYEDILAYRKVGLDGIVEDGSQRCFFPNGLALNVYAAALLDCDCDYDAVVDDYLRHCYGESWTEVKDYLLRISEAFDFAYLEGERSAEPAKGAFYNPVHAEILKTIPALTADARAIAEANSRLPIRVQSVCMRLLLRHAEYCERLSEVMTAKALGEDAKAHELWDAFRCDFGKYEFELERWFDHGQTMTSLRM